MSQQVEGWNLRSCNPRYGKDSSLEDELPGLVKSLGSPAYISNYKGHEWKGSHNNRSLGGRKGSRWFWTTYKSWDDPSSPLISEGTLDLCAFFVWVGSSSIRVFFVVFSFIKSHLDQQEIPPLPHPASWASSPPRQPWMQLNYELRMRSRNSTFLDGERSVIEAH